MSHLSTQHHRCWYMPSFSQAFGINQILPKVSLGGNSDTLPSLTDSNNQPSSYREPRVWQERAWGVRTSLPRLICLTYHSHKGPILPSISLAKVWCKLLPLLCYCCTMDSAHHGTCKCAARQQYTRIDDQKKCRKAYSRAWPEHGQTLAQPRCHWWYVHIHWLLDNRKFHTPKIDG